MFLKKAFFRISFSGFLFCLVIALTLKGAVIDTAKVVLIDGRVLDNRELQREMERYRSTVFNNYVREFQLTNTVDFWNTEYNGTTPLSKLEEKALEELRRLKVQEDILRKKNLWPYKTYQALLTDRIVSNERRKMAIQKNEVIYGPVEFTEQAFFDYQFSNAVIKLKRLMEGEEIPLSQKLLAAHFEKMKQNIFAGKDYTLLQVEKRVKAHYLAERYEQFVDSLSQKSTIVLTR